MNKESNTYQLPKSWAEVNFGDIVVLSKGKKPSLFKQAIEGAVPYLDIEGFEKSVIRQFSYPEESTMIDKKSLAMVWDGARSGLTFKGQEGALGSTIMKITPFIVESSYLYYYLLLKNDFIQKNTKGTGIPHVNSEILGKLRVPLPPLKEQAHIVEKIEELFSELDNGLFRLNEIQAQLNIYQHALLHWSFNNIDKGFVRLKEICAISGGVTKGKNLAGKETVEVPYLRVANVQDGYLDLTDVKTIKVVPSDKEKYRLLYGDVLYTEGGDRDKLGRGTVWREEIKNCIHQNHIFRARVTSSDFDPTFISYYSRTKAAKKYFYENGKQTTNLASINISILSELPIPICPIEDQLKIVETIDSHLSIYDFTIKNIRLAIQNILFLKQSILLKAFSGNLIPPYLNEKPVKELIEAIYLEKEKYYTNLKESRKQRPKKKKMNKVNKGIIEVLESSKLPLAAKEVWEQSMYSDNIEKFYAELKKVQHLILENKKGFLSLNHDNKKV
ncbi:restriction endonuclease subunit S [Mucilaginibacter sp. SJ]|uniref:restriction endonuclease subunit S n=1 Tax=Mucilaginibacter sp. SJ TaxID=3029053 RepID=UPI0023A9E68C|nr:restriction endonuclease subunit S [Mucilaginibacter sp. SJ]WDZ99447.1 restriction endonuclease subunit S [Mucilaginibacter sp. SJ]